MAVSDGDSTAGRRDFVASRIPFFYGWVMLPVAMITQMATSPGQTFGVSVFNPFLREALSLSQSAFSGAYMLGTLLASVPQTYVGSLMDRYGVRRTLTCVVLVFGLACLGMSQVRGLFSLFVAFLFLRMLGQGAMGLLSANALAMWFHRKLGFASGIVNVGMAAALGGVPGLALWLIDAYGWRWAYAFLGLGVWALMVPLLAIFFRNRPEDVGQIPDGDSVGSDVNRMRSEPDVISFSLSEALRTRSYWIGAAAMAQWSMIGTGIQFHMVQIFLDRGMMAEDAAVAFSVLAGTVAFTRFFGGMLADRVPQNWLLALAPFFQAMGLLLLLVMRGGWTAYVFAGVIGLGNGLLTAVYSTIWVRYFGRTHLGKIRGSLATITVAASSLGPFAMGFAYDFFGGYTEVLWVFFGIVGCMVFVGVLATPPVRKVAA